MEAKLSTTLQMGENGKREKPEIQDKVFNY